MLKSKDIMLRTHVSDLKGKISEQVRVEGFVQARRDQGGIKFLVVRDVTGTVQAIVTRQNGEVFDEVAKLTLESVIDLTGMIKEQKQAPGGFEIEIEALKVLSVAEPLPIPVVEEKSGGEVDAALRFDYRWLDLRKPEKLKIFKVWTALEKGFRKYFSDNGYVQVYSPSIMGTASEGGSEVFEVQYFDRKGYLAQSPQFYKQLAQSAGFEKVFMVGPVFRAEPSFTTRHMTEFTGWDFELSYIDSHEDIMQAEEAMLVEAFKTVKEEVMPELEIPTVPFPRMTMNEAKLKLKQVGVPSDKAGDFSSEEERELGRLVKEETGHDFVFVTEYGSAYRAFYHMRPEADQTVTKSYDLIYKGLEITTGAQREHRPAILKQQAQEKGIPTDQLESYFSFFRYGCPPHGGAGIGPGRIIMKLLDLESVKEATFLPRDVRRLTP
ncbi:TPA: aspartate--tRNA(Asn) ligase [candidate division WWE3 bacterium]|uniref:Aspartate--tRNA(Asp/Asn) ligase n=4 Tax=Katanobacteria TaxID=422282 RepID=A0A0G1KNJ0_UNCKA|nr:MAG: Aspartyl-tRNA synthetase [candidate division WWE3 bacterium GW2011_GWA2_44_16]KKT85045.1 MAG: Aspartyl-tRNA synthetase [candidate division WWE3 bacterium GW2011_GWC2_44_9]HAZ29272.1 aspartate--tRNA(Asn) ligase [candidate division WWE3 bacterium]